MHYPIAIAGLAKSRRPMRQSPADSGASRMTDGSAKSGERVTAAGAPRQDLAVAAVLVVLGVAVIGLGLQVEPGVQTDPLGPRAFPLALGAAIALCGLLLGVSTTLGRRWTASAAVFVESADDDASEGELHSPVRLVGAIAVTAVYLLAFERLGYLLATPGYVVGILLLQQGVRARAFLTAPVLVTLALYGAFRFGLLIPVPDGILEPWLPW
jgi:putative tricarboxylic transport membrane protein